MIFSAFPTITPKTFNVSRPLLTSDPYLTCESQSRHKQTECPSLSESLGVPRGPWVDRWPLKLWVEMTGIDHLLDFCQEEQAKPAIQKLNLEDPQILRLLKGNEWRDLWRKGLNLVPRKPHYVKVCERHWKPWYNWVVLPFLMHMSSLLRSCCHITSILLLYFLIHQTSLNHILIQMHHSRIWFHLFSRELHGPTIDQSCLGIRAQWCVWLQILQAAWPTSRWTAGFDSKIIIFTLGGKNKGYQGITKQMVSVKSVKWTFKKQPEQHVCETVQKEHLGGNAILHAWGSQNPFGV